MVLDVLSCMLMLFGLKIEIIAIRCGNIAIFSVSV